MYPLSCRMSNHYMIMQLKHPLLHLQVRTLLLQEIIHGEYSLSTMLPTEAELSRCLGVSRGTLRHAVTSLEQEGYLRRRHGVGTIIDRNICAMVARFDQNSEFSILLSQLGYEPEVRFLSVKTEIPDDKMVQIFKMQHGDQVLSITKLWLADGKPAIWCTDSIPTNSIVHPYCADKLQFDIFTFLHDYCNQLVSYQIASLTPRRIGTTLGKIFRIDPDEPVIASTSIGYNNDSVPIFFNSEVHAPGIMTQTVLRAKI